MTFCYLGQSSPYSEANWARRAGRSMFTLSLTMQRVSTNCHKSLLILPGKSTEIAYVFWKVICVEQSICLCCRAYIQLLCCLFLLLLKQGFFLGGRLTFVKLPRRLVTTSNLHSSVIRTLDEEVKSVVNSFHFLATGVLSSANFPQRSLCTRKVCLTRTHRHKRDRKEKKVWELWSFSGPLQLFGAVSVFLCLFILLFFLISELEKKKNSMEKKSSCQLLVVQSGAESRTPSKEKKSLMILRVTFTRFWQPQWTPSFPSVAAFRLYRN